MKSPLVKLVQKALGKLSSLLLDQLTPAERARAVDAGKSFGRFVRHRQVWYAFALILVLYLMRAIGAFGGGGVGAAPGLGVAVAPRAVENGLYADLARVVAENAASIGASCACALAVGRGERLLVVPARPGADAAMFNFEILRLSAATHPVTETATAGADGQAGRRRRVERSDWVEVRFLNGDGLWRELIVDGVTAECVQHYDEIYSGRTDDTTQSA